MTHEQPRAPVVLRYDADCAFCTRSARWIRARARDRHEVRLEPARGIAAVELIEADGTRLEGGAAITRLLAGSPRWGWLRAFDGPGLAPLRDATYALVSRLRRYL